MIQPLNDVANWQATYNSWADSRFGPLQASERDDVSSAKTVSDSDPVYRSVAGAGNGTFWQSVLTYPDGYVYARSRVQAHDP